MHGYIERKQQQHIQTHLQNFPCVIMLGARQVGKSTLAKKIIQNIENSIYLDLEDPRDLAKLQDPSHFLEANKDQLICLDEIQRLPELFPVLRGYLDRGNRAGQLLLLGSASQDLIHQSSESLAGRVSYIEISPLYADEVEDLKSLWLKGGYPNAYLHEESISYEWRLNYIKTFLERDIPSLGIQIASRTLHRFWKMLAHSNGSLLNASKLAASMGVSSPTIKKYIDLLEGTFVVHQLQPYFKNTKKRLVKSPKVYVRDSGLLHALLGIETYNELLGHPILGSSFESMVISTLIERYPKHEASFYRNSNGAEIDLILEKGSEILAFEIKSSTSPKLTKGFFNALEDLQVTQAFVIAQVNESYPIHKNIWVHPLNKMKIL